MAFALHRSAGPNLGLLVFVSFLELLLPFSWFRLVAFLDSGPVSRAHPVNCFPVLVLKPDFELSFSKPFFSL